jgi:hypothetical protein
MSWNYYINWTSGDKEAVVKSLKLAIKWVEYYQQAGFIHKWKLLPSGLHSALMNAASAVKTAKGYVPYAAEVTALIEALNELNTLEKNATPRQKGVAFGKVFICAAKLVSRLPTPANAYARPLSEIGGKLGDIAYMMSGDGMLDRSANSSEDAQLLKDIKYGRRQ